MSLKTPTSLVSVDWLLENLNNKHLIILDATITNINSNDAISSDKKQITNARFFDLKNTFSDVDAPFPNTMLSTTKFEEKAKELGINATSCIIVYDDLGIYASPRVWWMFTLMGFENIAVLNGGLPDWKKKRYPIENPKNIKYSKGNFTSNYNSNKIAFTADVLAASENKEILILDARSAGRFFGTAPEPRNDVKSGHIPNSLNLPYEELFEGGNLKSKSELKKIFSELNPNNKPMIFSCGSGITASILDFAATLTDFKNTSVYDGSWTAWGSAADLPIEV